MKRLLIHLIILLPFWVVAQTPYSINYTTRDGLPTNELYWLCQSQDKSLWIGSTLGLLRFDGQHFKRYVNSEVRNKSISAIFEDRYGQIWCSNFSNQVFYVEDDSLHLFKAWDAVKDPEDNFQNFENALNDGELIIFSEKYVYKVNKDRTLLELKDSMRTAYLLFNQELELRYRLSEGLSYTNKQGEEYQVDCQGCFYSYSDEGQTLKRFPTGRLIANSESPYLCIGGYNNKRYKFQNSKGEFALDQGGKLPYLFKIDLKKQKSIPLYFPDAISNLGKGLQIYAASFQSDSVLWLATNYGLFSWNLIQNKAEHYYKNEVISDLLIDQDGSIWLSTTSSGLFFLPDLRIQQLDFQTQAKRATAIEISPSGKMFLGFDDGQLEWINLKDKNQQHKIKKMADFPIESVSYNPYEQEFWVSNISTQIFDENGEKKQDLAGNTIKEAFFDSSGLVVQVKGFTIDLLKYKQTASRQIEAWGENYNKLEKEGDVKGIRLRTCCNRPYSGLYLKGSEDQIWAGFSDNLTIFRPKGSKIIKDQDAKSIVATDMVQTEDGSIWVATFNKGLLQLKEEEVVATFSRAKGLPDIYISDILKDQQYLWLATTKGIVRFNWKSKELVVYDEYYGVPNLLITDMALWNNRLYFIADKRILSFDTRIEPETTTAPSIQLAAFWINEQEVSPAENINLKPSQNNIKIQLSAISYRSQGAHQFKYRLEGLEKEWIIIDGNNDEIRYPSLPPGTYTFEAYALNKWGKISEEAVTIKFVIPPALYQTLWFQILLFLGIFLFIATLFWWQLKRIQKRNQEKLERSELESELRVSQLKALKAQMNPHFIFNALNSIQALYAMNEPLKANQQLSKFSQLVRQTLDLSNETYIPLSAELELLNLYLQIEQTRFMDALEYSLKAPENIDFDEIMVPSLLIQPYVENAVKHGLLHKDGEKKVEVELIFFENEQLLEVIIDDNGIGRAASQEINAANKKHQSFATTANATRLALLNEERKAKNPIGVEFIDKYDQSEKALGTRVIIKIPIDYKYESTHR
jgi:ligand-binding sensor domain-containing protein